MSIDDHTLAAPPNTRQQQIRAAAVVLAQPDGDELMRMLFAPVTAAEGKADPRRRADRRQRQQERTA